MRQLLEFSGGVSVRSGSGAVGLTLRGTPSKAPMLRAGAGTGAAAPGLPPQGAVELLFGSVVELSPALPALLHGVRVTEHEPESLSVPGAHPDARASRRFRIDADEGQYSVRARSMQLHADPSRAFYAVLPAEQVPRLTRWGWSALLTVLRVRPIVRLLGGRRA